MVALPARQQHKWRGANLPLLSALTDRSLVQRTAVGRYSLHSLVRQYANDYLQADPEDQETAAQRHSDYYLRWLADREGELRGMAQKEALVDIALELANIRLAWQQAVDTQQFALLRAASFPLFYFYELRGLVQEAERTFHRAADTLVNAPNAASREGQLAINDMRTNLGYFQIRLGQITAAFVLLEQVVAHLQALEDEVVLSCSLRYLALALTAGGRYDEALQFLQQSLALAERHDRRWEIPITQAYIGMVLHDMGEIDEAQLYIEAALSGSRALGDARLIAYCLMLAGRSNLELKRLDLASEQLETSLAMGEETNDPYTISMAYFILGLIRRAQGDFTTARLLLSKAIDLFGLVDDLVGVERVSVNLGLLEIDTGNLFAAKTSFLNMLQIGQREHPPRYMLMAALSLAVIRNREGDPFTALVWTLFVLQHPTLDGRTQLLAEKLQAELEDELTSDQIASAQAQAAQQSLADIVTEIVSQLPYYEVKETF